MKISPPCRDLQGGLAPFNEPPTPHDNDISAGAIAMNNFAEVLPEGVVEDTFHQHDQSRPQATDHVTVLAPFRLGKGKTEADLLAQISRR